MIILESNSNLLVGNGYQTSYVVTWSGLLEKIQQRIDWNRHIGGNIYSSLGTLMEHVTLQKLCAKSLSTSFVP